VLPEAVGDTIPKHCRHQTLHIYEMTVWQTRPCIDAFSTLSRAAGETVESLRRYEIATVRRRGGGRGPPAAHLAADLDFVAPRAATAAEAALLEAEVILVRHPWQLFDHRQAVHSRARADPAA
jgi:hypothetical protein